MLHNIRSKVASKSFWKLNLMLVVVLSFAVLAPVAAQDATQEPAPSGGFKAVSSAWFPALTVNGTFTQVIRLFDFPAGSGTGQQTYSGPTVLSMMDGGALTLAQDGVDKVFGAWASWNEMPDKAHEAFNAGDTTARVIASYLVPDGAQPAVSQEASERPAGTQLFEAQFPGQTMDGMFIELVRVIDFPAQTGTGLHVHGGPTYLLMIEGALTLRRDGTDTLYGTGESWVEMPGPDSEHEAFNASDKPARVIAVYLLPMAPPLTFIQ